jgi:hypothetical protein
MPVAISVQEATLRTLRVEIQSLVVSGKQVTQSVFRQLYDAPVLDWATGKARGPLWGRVNYRWTGHDHEHLIWQLGDELRRDCVDSEYQTRFEHREFRAEGEILKNRNASTVAGLLRVLHDPPAKTTYQPPEGGYLVEWSPSNESEWVWWTRSSFRYHHRLYNHGASLARSGVEAYLSELGVQVIDKSALVEWVEKWREYQRQVKVRQERVAAAQLKHNATERVRWDCATTVWSQIEDLPQLFVAT